VIPRETADEIWVAEHGGAAEAAFRQHLRVYWNGPTREDDVEPQITLTEKAIRANSYGLLLSPDNPFALDTLIDRALSRGIPVVIVGAAIPVAARQGLSFVLNDENKGAALIAGRLHRVLGGKGKVLILGVNPLSPGSVSRAEAVQRALERDDPQIQIVDELSGSSSFGQAELVTEQAIRTHPELDAIIALGINESRGAVAAVASSGAAGRVRIVACDQTMDLLFLLRESMIDSLIVQDSRSMGSIAVGNLVAQHHERNVPESVLVEPRLVTLANVDDPVIQAILSENWRPAR
jgi:ribose transport system substrate-binding protein